MSGGTNNKDKEKRNDNPKNLSNFKLKKEPQQFDENNPVIIDFRRYAKELTDKHDRYERIVKISRDITIESKRIIFLLHTVDKRHINYENILRDAEKRLNKLCKVEFAAIAKQLHGHDVYQYARAYSAGLQEFVECYTYYEYLNNNKEICTWKDLQLKLQYKNDDVDTKSGDDKNVLKNQNTIGDTTVINLETAEDVINKDVMETEEDKTMANNEYDYMCLIQPIEFMLGLLDLGGEIMRRCVNSLGSGDIQTCLDTCKFLRQLFVGYMRHDQTQNRQMTRKITTLRESLVKVENVCYNISICGAEAAIFRSSTCNVVIVDKGFD